LPVLGFRAPSASPLIAKRTVAFAVGAGAVQKVPPAAISVFRKGVEKR
jgi:hypothetical protein